MNTWIARRLAPICLLAASVPSVAAGETIVTERGREYRDCEIVGRDPHGVTFRHSTGMAKVAYSDLGADQQKRFGYDRASAEAFLAKHRPAARPAPAHTGRPGTAPVSNRVEIATLSSRPRGRGAYNPYAFHGPIHNPALAGAAFGGFLQPYYASGFGTPALVTPVPGGFFSGPTLRAGARPILESPVAPGMVSYSQYRDTRAGAVRAAVRATPSARPAPAPAPARGGKR